MWTRTCSTSSTGTSPRRISADATRSRRRAGLPRDARAAWELLLRRPSSFVQGARPRRQDPRPPCEIRGTKKLEGDLGCPSRPRRRVPLARGWFRLSISADLFGRCAPPAMHLRRCNRASSYSVGFQSQGAVRAARTMRPNHAVFSRESFTRERSGQRRAEAPCYRPPAPHGLREPTRTVTRSDVLCRHTGSKSILPRVSTRRGLACASSPPAGQGRQHRAPVKERSAQRPRTPSIASARPCGRVSCPLRLIIACVTTAPAPDSPPAPGPPSQGLGPFARG